MLTYIGPGQHIRPAPQWGPGSNSMSGLVDYSNVFVKVSLVAHRQLTRTRIST